MAACSGRTLARARTHVGAGTNAEYSGIEFVALLQIESGNFISKRSIWWMIRQFWPEEKWVRVRDDQERAGQPRRLDDPLPRRDPPAAEQPRHDGGDEPGDDHPAALLEEQGRQDDVDDEGDDDDDEEHDAGPDGAARRLEDAAHDAVLPYGSWQEEGEFFYHCLCSRGYPRDFLRAVFQEIGPMRLAPLGSPVLQRKAGYREVCRERGFAVPDRYDEFEPHVRRLALAVADLDEGELRGADEARLPRGVIRAMRDPAAAEHLSPIEVAADRRPCRCPFREAAADVGAKLRRDRLIRIERELEHHRSLRQVPGLAPAGMQLPDMPDDALPQQHARTAPGVHAGMVRRLKADVLKDLPAKRRQVIVFDAPDIAWYGDMDLLPHLTDLITGGPIDVQVVFGQTLAFDSQTDRKMITKQAESEVRRLFQDRSAGRRRQQRISVLSTAKTV